MTAASSPEKFVRSESVLSRELADALLLLSPGRGDVVSLSGSGPEIWRMLGSPLTVETVVQQLAEKYGVDSTEIAADVRQTLEALVAARVIRRLAA
jgi:hypothetical protein